MLELQARGHQVVALSGPSVARHWSRPASSCGTTMAHQFVSGSDEVLPLTLEDLDALRDGPLMLATGVLVARVADPR